MRILKYIFDFYIQSSLHVALAVYTFIRMTFFKLNISYDESVACFGFFGTIVGYNFIKYDELARVKKIKLTKTFKAIIFLSVISAMATFYYFLELKTKTKLIGIGSLLLTILYTLPFFPNRTNMRNWTGLKIYLVVIAWV
ncbi:MAG: Na+/H+-translocating membrane pyrophosphatase, partial [Flavobacterium sp.]